VEEILKKKYSVINTAKKGKVGDFMINIGCNILVEVKKYSRPVPSNEIDKFVRDIESNSSIDGAIMISLSSKITGKSNSIELQTHTTIHGEIPTIYLNLSTCSCPEMIIYSCMDMFNCWTKYKNKDVTISDKIITIIDKINRNIDHLSQCRLIIHETQNHINKQFSKLLQAVMTAEIQIKESINNLKSMCSVEEIEYSSLDFSKIKIDDEYKNMVQTIIKTNNAVMYDNIIKCGNVTFKIGKTGKILKTEIYTNELSEYPQGAWSFNGKTLVLQLNELNLPIIEKLLK
jgi:hypothetical protein